MYVYTFETDMAIKLINIPITLKSFPVPLGKLFLSTLTFHCPHTTNGLFSVTILQFACSKIFTWKESCNMHFFYWLCSLSIIILRVTHFAAYINSSFLLITELYSLEWIQHKNSSTCTWTFKSFPIWGYYKESSQ